MRTVKRFSPELLERFQRQGRGLGTYQDYIPWHRVGRGDPSSLGRSHLMVWRERQRELLSDGEWVGLLFSTMFSNLEDVREQHKLSLECSAHEITMYDMRSCSGVFPGTLSIANALCIKYPKVYGDGESENWTMTTDQVLVLRRSDGSLELLAVAYKPDRDKLTKRKKQLLAIEKQYWNARGVKWLLITPDLFMESVGLTLRRSVPWGLGSSVSKEEASVAASITSLSLGNSFTYTLDSIALALGDKDLAQRAFWQAVWFGAIPMDLNVGWRPHLPVRLLSKEAFWVQNPVASRRSAWL